MDDLLAQWTATYNTMIDKVATLEDERDAATAEIRAKIAALEAELALITPPFDLRAVGVRVYYEQRLEELEARIRPLAIAHGRSHTANGARVAFRKGYTKVTYDPARTDTVKVALLDLLPNMALALEAARKVTQVEPSVKIERI